MGFTTLHKLAFDVFKGGLFPQLCLNPWKIDETDYLGRTPLHLSIEYRNYRATKALLDAGAKPHARDRNGQSVLHYACTEANVGLCEFLPA